MLIALPMSPATAQRVFDNNIKDGMKVDDARRMMVDALSTYWTLKFEAMQAAFTAELATVRADVEARFNAQIDKLCGDLGIKKDILRSTTQVQSDLEVERNKAKEEAKEANRKLNQAMVLVDDLRALLEP